MIKVEFRRLVPVAALLAVAACSAGGGDTTPPGPAPTTSVAAPPSSAGPTAAPPRSPVATPPPTRATTRPGTPESTSTAFTGLELAKTGGFAGVNQSVTVKPDGSWQRLDGKKVTVSGKLNAGQLGELKGLLTAPQLAREADRKVPPNRCADAFAYVLRVNSEVIRYTQCDAADRPEQTLKVITFVERATSG
ncbi:hypothetical protein [Paractinoplanes rishiriensis]|uniref:Secreted protein n=1 Tax=Paractinoplanes rishiriensis TaxID=1050105 RepID=A0A919MZU0_9ACTN|nr:hypothetical protein [Actinoplanes rishiriensis]GIE94237.1 hypothetical protein Ari01nite_17020 [Actinoplanes rishiriensis]